MLNEKLVKDRIAKLNAEIKEENLVRNNYIEMAGRLQLSVVGKAKAVEELMALIKEEEKPPLKTGKKKGK